MSLVQDTQDYIAKAQYKIYLLGLEICENDANHKDSCCQVDGIHELCMSIDYLQNSPCAQTPREIYDIISYMESKYCLDEAAEGTFNPACDDVIVYPPFEVIEGPQGPPGEDGLDGIGYVPVRLHETNDLGGAFNGTTITAGVNGQYPNIDGVTPDLDDVILLSGRTNQEENGIYRLVSTGSGSEPWVLSRSEQMDSDQDFNALPYVSVELGTSYANTLWTLQAVRGALVLNTDPAPFTQIDFPYVNPFTNYSNGITEYPNYIGLGGALVQNTAVTGDFDLDFGISSDAIKNLRAWSESCINKALRPCS